MIFSDTILIGNHIITPTSKTFIIGEAGVNHNGDIQLAKELIDVAKEAGVDAVKFQSFKTESLILQDIEKAPYQMNTTSKSESQYEMLKNLELSINQMRTLYDHAKNAGLVFLTTPFDEVSLDELDSLGLVAYKVSSTDLTNIPFLRKVAKKGKPLILSTGMSFFSEVELALKAIYPYSTDVILLHCTGNYPFKDDEANLRVLQTYAREFDILIGYSDHSEGIGAAPYAVAMGATVIEKHFTLDKSMKGPDHKASLSPSELKDLVASIKAVERYMGGSEKVPTLSERKTRTSLQKCLVAKTAIRKGDRFNSENLIAKRTGGKGISPIYFDDLLLKSASRNYEKDEIIDE